MWKWVERAIGRNVQNSAPISVGSPAVAGLFDTGSANYSGVDISESTSLSLSAVYRAVALIAGTIGTLPLRTLRDTGDGLRERIHSVFDNPGGPIGLVPFNWTETVLCHLLLHGNAYLKHIYGGAGQLVALLPVHPLLVSVELPRPGERRPAGGKWFRLTKTDGTRESLDGDDMTQIMGMSLDGITGLSIISLARNGFGTALAGDRSAAKMFSQGALIAGMVTPDGDEDGLEDGEPQDIRRAIEASATGWENASGIPVINRKLKFTPWTMSSVDAQFLESRQFSVREIARWFGIPPHLLMETSAASNWGTGIEQQNLGLARFNLVSWTCRIEQTLSTLLPNPRWVEYDFAGLERPTPEVEIQLLIDQVAAGLLTVNEARAIRNLPPIDPPPTPAEQAVTDPVEEDVPA